MYCYSRLQIYLLQIYLLQMNMQPAAAWSLAAVPQWCKGRWCCPPTQWWPASTTCHVACCHPCVPVYVSLNAKRHSRVVPCGCACCVWQQVSLLHVPDPACTRPCCMQWELIAGGDLLELLNECNGCMTEAAAAFYYVQLLRGVLHMHAMGYCHRWARRLASLCRSPGAVVRTRVVSVAACGLNSLDMLCPSSLNVLCPRGVVPRPNTRPEAQHQAVLL